MSRETIRASVLEKFKATKGWSCKDFTELYNKIVDSLTICDPAMGSGHFLVSVLNEIIAIKSELGILADS